MMLLPERSYEVQTVPTLIHTLLLFLFLLGQQFLPLLDHVTIQLREYWKERETVGLLVKHFNQVVGLRQDTISLTICIVCKIQHYVCTTAYSV